MDMAASIDHGRQTESSHRRAVERVILSMHDSLESGMSLDDMAREAFISPFHFNRVFRRVVGIPPSHYLSALRIETAKRLLAATEERIIDVCLDVGFTSPGTFSRRFKDMVGLSPREFRHLADHGAPRRPSPPRPPAAAPASPMHGTVSAPPGFGGHAFVGLFRTPLPYHRPVGCCCVEEPGAFSIPAVPDGDYYLLALGYPEKGQPQDYLLADQALRAGSTNQPVRIRGGRPSQPLELALRTAEITDPPILVTVPWLMV